MALYSLHLRRTLTSLSTLHRSLSAIPAISTPALQSSPGPHLQFHAIAPLGSHCLIPAISSPDGVPSSNCSQFKVSFTESKKPKKKLKDYLDLVLLSKVSSKIGCAKKVHPEAKPNKVAKDFKWPVNELKVFVADSKSENRGNWRSSEVMDLKDDLDLIGDSGDALSPSLGT